MLEYYTKGLVLRRDPRGESDATLILYTKDFGKISAKAKSIRKITSKLSGHLVPGRIADIRLVEAGGNSYQIVDALSLESVADGRLMDLLDFLDKMAPAGVPDLHLWNEVLKILMEGDLSESIYRRLLLIMGFVPEESKCENCNRLKIAYFLPLDIIFLCSECFTNLGVRAINAFQI